MLVTALYGREGTKRALSYLNNRLPLLESIGRCRAEQLVSFNEVTAIWSSFTSIECSAWHICPLAHSVYWCAQPEDVVLRFGDLDRASGDEVGVAA